MITREGSTVLADAPGGKEAHVFASEAEATARAAFVNEALTWTGTPFRDCADVKGPSGAVDCAMMLTRCAVDTGLLPAFDPRPYPPRWHLHRSEERFVNWVTDQLGAREVAAPRVGDLVLWMFGRTFSHAAVLINSVEVLHAWYVANAVLVSRLDEPLLSFLPTHGAAIARPVRYFDLWSARA